MKTYKAPFDFVPLPSELAANRDRVVPLREIDGELTPVQEVDGPSVSAAAAAVATAAEVERQVDVPVKVTNIRDLNLPTAIAYINKVTNETELNRVLLQESNGKPIRKKVLQAIESRRDEIIANNLLAPSQ